MKSYTSFYIILIDNRTVRLLLRFLLGSTSDQTKYWSLGRDFSQFYMLRRQGFRKCLNFMYRFKFKKFGPPENYNDLELGEVKLIC